MTDPFDDLDEYEDCEGDPSEYALCMQHQLAKLPIIWQYGPARDRARVGHQ